MEDDEKIYKRYNKQYTLKAANTWEYSGQSFSFDYAYIVIVVVNWHTAQPAGITISSSSTSLTSTILSQFETSSGYDVRLVSYVDMGRTVYFWYKTKNTGYVICQHYVIPITYQQV